MFTRSIAGLLFLLITLVLPGCGTVTDQAKTDGDTSVKKADPQMLVDNEPGWKDRGHVVMAIDTNLSHSNGGFSCDSAVIFHYIGFFGEHTYMVLNDKGQWINTIQAHKKLTTAQVNFVHSVFGSRSTFKHPMIVSCFEPRIAIVYFKSGKVIAQSDICLSCCRIQSTARLGNKEYYDSINENARTKLARLYDDVGFKPSFQK